MKPVIEQIGSDFGSSFTIHKHSQQYLNRKPIWHAHNEYEIVYVSDGVGKRHIGNHISYYEGGDLIFLGPELPHYGFTQEQMRGHYEIVVQLKADFLGAQLLNRVECSDIKSLLDKARTGLSFYGNTKAAVGRKLLKAYKAVPFERLIKLLEVLQEMATSEEVVALNAKGIATKVMVEDKTRLRAIHKYVEQNFRQSIPLEDVAELVSMTVPAFCRFFKKAAGQTFTQFVNEIRVMWATRLLAESDLLIIEVAHESGFNNLSHFNKHFLKVTGQRPSAYRRAAGNVVTVMDELV